ncbi:MAG: DNA-binding protein [Bacteroidales bacterium 45-6]|nr:MAG: DNA-binding protein [Bacteroidales bacterium 45-6]
MTHKELVAELAKRLGQTQAKTSELLEAFTTVMNERLAEGNSVSFQGFGLFETKKKMERISVNPVTKQRFLIPPKISAVYRPSQNVKDLLNSKDNEH